MSVKTLLASVVNFIGHYGNEASGIAAALTNIVGALPMSKVEKAKVTEVISGLETASENIAAKINELIKAASADAVPVKIDKKDVEAAVAAVVNASLPAMVDKAVAAALAKLPAPAPAAAPSGASQ